MSWLGADSDKVYKDVGLVTETQTHAQSDLLRLTPMHCDLFPTAIYEAKLGEHFGRNSDRAHCVYECAHR